MNIFLSPKIFSRSFSEIEILEEIFGFFDFVKKSDFNSVILDVIGVSFHKFNSNFALSFDDLLINFIFPKIKDLSSFHKSDCVSLGHLFRSRSLIGSSPIVNNSKFLDFFFGDFFDSSIINSPENFLELFNVFLTKNPFVAILPFLLTKLKTIISVHSKISVSQDIVYQEVFHKLSKLSWNLLENSISSILLLCQEVIFSLSKETQIILIHFLEDIFLGYSFYFSIENFSFLKDKIIFVLSKSSKNVDVQKALQHLFAFLIRFFNPSETLISKFIEESVVLIQDKTNEGIGILSGSAVLGSLLLEKTSPKFLPSLFEHLSSKFYSSQLYTTLISSAAQVFWNRHQFHELPEIEEFRFSFFPSYFS